MKERVWALQDESAKGRNRNAVIMRMVLKKSENEIDYNHNSDNIYKQ